ncbi:MAG: DNA polymerase III subunit delta' [Boseongicola sp.]
MIDSEIPEADRIDGAPHPRNTVELFGQETSERALIAAHVAGRLHHALLITGPRGTGKATLAWRAARFLLSQDSAKREAGLFEDAPPVPNSLDVAIDAPVCRRIAALSEPRLLLIRRAWDADRKRLKTQITVEEVRKLGGFFGLSSADGGHRAVIIDSADELNVSAGNALLKVLEEPPRNTTFFLISHAPARLLPTIRSRCRELRLSALSQTHFERALSQVDLEGEVSPALCSIAGGSVGEAIRLHSNDGAEYYRRIVELLSKCPQMDRSRALSFAGTVAQRGKDQHLDIAIYLLELVLSRLARMGVGHSPATECASGETEILVKLSPTPRVARKWAELQREISERFRRGRDVNVDPQSLVLDALLKINETSGNS